MSDPEVTDQSTELAPQQKQNKQYYYWHGHEKQRAAEGDVAPKTTPQLVGTVEAPVQSPICSEETFEKYSWCNNNASVSVYIDHQGVGSIPSEALTVQFGPQNLDVVLFDGSRKRVLRLVLNKPINAEKSSFRLKPDQIVIKAVKPDGNTETWFDLTGKIADADSDDE